MASNVYDVIFATTNLIKVVGIFMSAISRSIESCIRSRKMTLLLIINALSRKMVTFSWILCEICFDISLMTSIDSSCHTRPCMFHTKMTFSLVFGTLVIQQTRFNTIKGTCRLAFWNFGTDRTFPVGT